MASVVSPGGREWKLPERIINLSQANTWKEAVKEWESAGIELLAPGEFDQCLCGHIPIRQLCFIRNIENRNAATVGNCCIQKFEDEDLEGAAFASVPTIIQACQRILSDPSASANEALIEYAEEKGLFTQRDASFYRSIWRKRSLSDKQESYKKSLNQKLLYGVILSARAAFERLQRDRTGTAGPKLVNFAFEKRVLTQRDKDFYLQIWSRSRLSDKQSRYKLNLNQRMIQQLPPHFNRNQGASAAQSQAQQQAASPSTPQRTSLFERKRGATTIPGSEHRQKQRRVTGNRDEQVQQGAAPAQQQQTSSSVSDDAALRFWLVDESS